MAYSACINISTYTNMDTFMYYTYSVDPQSVPSTCLYVYSCLYYYIYIHIHSYIYTIYIYIYILLVLFLCYILYKFAHNFQFAVAHDSGVAGRPPEGPFQWRSHAVVVSWWSGILTIWIKLDPLGSVEFWMTYDIWIWMKYENIWNDYLDGIFHWANEYDIWMKLNESSFPTCIEAADLPCRLDLKDAGSAVKQLMAGGFNPEKSLAILDHHPM